MIDKPRLITPLMYSVMASLFLVTANQVKISPGVYIILMVAGTGCAVAAAVEFTWLCLRRGVEIAAEIKRIKLQTPKSYLLSIIARMSGPQLAALERSAPSILVYGSDAGPMFSLETQAGKIPFAFVREFLRRSPGLALAPIRTYHEGSVERENASMLTDHLIYHGYALHAAGNVSARWKTPESRDRFIRAIEIDMGEPENEVEE